MHINTNFFSQFSISTASPLDAMTVFLNSVLGGNQTPDGYLMYLLVMCGLFIIALVFVYNWWEERRFNAHVEKSFSTIKDDALLDQNKKQFLEKFASTTGYLSDAPDAGRLLNQQNDIAYANPADVEKSIDDVYSELLDTMSKRSNQKNKSDEDVDLSNFSISEAPFNEPEQSTHEEVINAIDPAQHSAIKSIIDQVFKNKGFLGKTTAELGAENNAPAYQTPIIENQTESGLDAFLSAKNAMELEQNFNDVVALDSEEKNDELQPVYVVDDHELPIEKALDDGHDLAELIGLSVVENQPLTSVALKTSVEAGASDIEKPLELNNGPLPIQLNLQIDLIGLLELTTNAALGLLVDSFSGLYKDFDKPVSVYVQDVSNQWVLLNNVTAQHLQSLGSHTHTQRIVCGLQLADRSGAVSQNMINRFQLAFEAVAANMGGRVAWQNEGSIFSQAMALDAFCIEVDKTMFFHLMHESTGPFTGIKLRGLAEAQGMKLTDSGAFKFFDTGETEHAEFVMFNRDNHPFKPEMLRTSVVKSVTFQLDIPHTKSNTQALDRMLSVAKYLEVGLGAVLVDDNNRPLGELQIEKIREQIKSIHATMQLRGILPGSNHAHRLFS